jgi:sulfatase modifying factor 1
VAGAEGLPEPYLKALRRLVEAAAEGRAAQPEPLTPALPALPERAAQQAERLRVRFGVTPTQHEALLVSLLGSADEPSAAPPALECAARLEWLEGGGVRAHIALIHGGDFTFERVEVSIFDVGAGRASRLTVEGLEPDERSHLVALLEGVAGGEGEGAAGLQLQLKAVDIADEVLYLRSPAVAWARPPAAPAPEAPPLLRAPTPWATLSARLAGGDGRAEHLCAPESRLEAAELTERRVYFSLLGGPGWLRLPLAVTPEGSFYGWEVAASRPQERWGGGRAHGERLEVRVGGVVQRERLCHVERGWVGAPLGVGHDWETPPHLAQLSRPLWCAELPVTQALWREVMGGAPSAREAPEAPVDSVSWFEAVELCNRLSARLGLRPAYTIWQEERGRCVRREETGGYRLPTEVEWELLARAGQDRPFAGSHTPELVCWSLERGVEAPQPAGGLRPNQWGLYDMSGNVWEWCEDRFDELIYRRRVGKVSDPVEWCEGPASRVRRGGSWATSEAGCRVFSRAQGAPEWRSHFVGVRVVRPEVGGADPRDVAEGRGEVTWALLTSRPVMIVGDLGSDRRRWAVRLEALGGRVTRREEEAGVAVWVWSPREGGGAPQRGSNRGGAASVSPSQARALRPARPSAAVEGLLRRVAGRGGVALEEDALASLLEAREAELLEGVSLVGLRAPLPLPLEGFPAPQRARRGRPPLTSSHRRVGVVGRMSVTRATLSARLVAAGFSPVVLSSGAPLRGLEWVVCGGGALAGEVRALAGVEGVRVLTELECLVMLGGLGAG